MTSKCLYDKKKCSQRASNIPIFYLLWGVVMSTLVFFIIGIMTLVAGYNPRILTDSTYKYVQANVIGYGQEDVKCYYQCNCRSVCKPSHPNCKYPWQRERICDSCSNPCKNAWVVLSISPPGPSYVFNGFGSVGNEPLSDLQTRYPINSTIEAYYWSKTLSNGQPYVTIVYGDTMAQSINCFIAGFFFVGLGILMWLVFGILCIFYCFGLKAISHEPDIQTENNTKCNMQKCDEKCDKTCKNVDLDII